MTRERLKPERPPIENAWASSRLGAEFWEMLNEISILEGKSLGEMVEKIDRMRGKSSRASAIRVFVLKYFQSQAALSATERPSQRPPALGADCAVVLPELLDS
jgi:predicted DNA-binding ribbon-helix-helix protein